MVCSWSLNPSVIIDNEEHFTAGLKERIEAARILADKGIKVYTVGIGTGKEVLVPVRSDDGRTIVDYYIDEDGEYLRTSLVQDTLKNIANITGGEYFRLTEEKTPEKLTQAILERAKTVEETKSVELAWFNLSPLFILAGLISFIVGVLTVS